MKKSEIKDLKKGTHSETIEHRKTKDGHDVHLHEVYDSHDDETTYHVEHKGQIYNHGDDHKSAYKHFHAAGTPEEKHHLKEFGKSEQKTENLNKSASSKDDEKHVTKYMTHYHGVDSLDEHHNPKDIAHDVHKNIKSKVDKEHKDKYIVKHLVHHGTDPVNYWQKHTVKVTGPKKSMDHLSTKVGWLKHTPEQKDPDSPDFKKSEGIDEQRAQNDKEMYNENPKPRSTTKFVAFNADNVSSKLIDHIQANDHVGLSQASRNLSEASDVIASWVENARGTIISRASDEIIAMVPEEALGTIDEVKASYKQLSGHDLTAGIGDSLADAANSLIGNKNGQESLDSESEEDQDMPEDIDNDGQPDEMESHGEIDPEQDDLDGDGEISHEEAETSDKLDETPPEGDVSEDDIAEGEAAASEVKDQAGEEAAEEYAEEYAEEVPEMDDTQDIPEHEQDLSPEEKATHDATEDASDSEEIEQDADAEATERDEEDPDMIEDQEENSELGEDQENPDMAEDDEEIPELGEDEVAQPDEDSEMDQGLEPEEQELYDLLSQNLNDEPESSSIHEAKAKIVETLNALRANKEGIEQLKHTDPDAYGSLLDFIRSMIDMAKQTKSGEAEDIEAAPEAEVDESSENDQDQEDQEEEQPVKKLQG